MKNKWKVLIVVLILVCVFVLTVTGCKKKPKEKDEPQIEKVDVGIKEIAQGLTSEILLSRNENTNQHGVLLQLQAEANKDGVKEKYLVKVSGEILTALLEEHTHKTYGKIEVFKVEEDGNKKIGTLQYDGSDIFVEKIDSDGVSSFKRYSSIYFHNIRELLFKKTQPRNIKIEDGIIDFLGIITTMQQMFSDTPATPKIKDIEGLVKNSDGICTFAKEVEGGLSLGIPLLGGVFDDFQDVAKTRVIATVDKNQHSFNFSGEFIYKDGKEASVSLAIENLNSVFLYPQDGGFKLSPTEDVVVDNEAQYGEAQNLIKVNSKNKIQLETGDNVDKKFYFATNIDVNPMAALPYVKIEKEITTNNLRVNFVKPTDNPLGNDKYKDFKYRHTLFDASGKVLIDVYFDAFRTGTFNTYIDIQQKFLKDEMTRYKETSGEEVGLDPSSWGDSEDQYEKVIVDLSVIMSSTGQFIIPSSASQLAELFKNVEMPVGGGNSKLLGELLNFMVALFDSTQQTNDGDVIVDLVKIKDVASRYPAIMKMGIMKWINGLNSEKVRLLECGDEDPDLTLPEKPMTGVKDFVGVNKIIIGDKEILDQVAGDAVFTISSEDKDWLKTNFSVSTDAEIFEKLKNVEIECSYTTFEGESKTLIARICSIKGDRMYISPIGSSNFAASINEVFGKDKNFVATVYGIAFAE